MGSHTIKLNEEELKQIIKQAINEELGSFENQNQMAQFLTDEVELAYKNGDYDILCSIPYVGSIKYAEIHITDDYLIYNLAGINPNQKKVIINIPKAVFSSNEELANIMNSVAHELMHGNVYLQQTWHGYHSMTVPDSYKKACQMRDGESTKVGILYYFAYALYSTYYQEVNACVSQTSAEIIDGAKGYGGILYMQDFKKLYANTNSVIVYNTNIKELNCIISSDDNNINRLIIEPMKKYGINMSVGEVRDKCQKMIDISDKALKDCKRNAMLAYKELIDSGKLVGYDKQEPVKLKEYPCHV